MPKEEKNIIRKVTKTQDRFLDFCEKIGYAEAKLIIMDGLPVKLLKPIKSIRFDLEEASAELSTDKDLTNKK